MEIGIGLPTTVPGVQRSSVVDWAQHAERAGFASVGTIDRIAYNSYESLISLAAVAAVTERIRLVTDILIAPLRSNTALLAKQAATLDSMSGGRLVLGLAVGGRADDYAISGVDLQTRGRAFDRQLDELTRVWAGDELGPAPANGERPSLLIGGSTEHAFRRAAEHADGWTMGGGSPEQFAQAREALNAAWQAAGRSGEPRTMILCYFALGPDGGRLAAEYLSHYYAFLGEYARQVIRYTPTDAQTLKGYLGALEQAGVGEVICFPVSTAIEQVELLAEAVGL